MIRIFFSKDQINLKNTKFFHLTNSCPIHIFTQMCIFLLIFSHAEWKTHCLLSLPTGGLGFYLSFLYLITDYNEANLCLSYWNKSDMQMVISLQRYTCISREMIHIFVTLHTRDLWIIAMLFLLVLWSSINL